MKKSFLVQFTILIALFVITNLVKTTNNDQSEEIFGGAGGIRVDLTGDQTIFESSPSDLPPRMGGTLVKAESAEPENLNYYTSTSAAASRYLDYIYEPLVSYDFKTWKYDRPVLAEKFEISPDKKTYTFYLHKNITWQDGKPLTAADVLFSLDRKSVV